MRAFRTSVEDGGSLVSASQLDLSELQLRIVTLRTLVVDELLRSGDLLRDFKQAEVIAFAL